MKKFRVALGIGAACVLIGHISVLNYHDLSWSQKHGSIFGDHRHDLFNYCNDFW